jgi:lantibiotic modifying enzyme
MLTRSELPSVSLWAPIAPPQLAARMRSAAADLVRQIPRLGHPDMETLLARARYPEEKQSGELARGAAGRELFHWYAARVGLGSAEQASASSGVEGLRWYIVNQAFPPGLFLGISGLMWTCCHLDHQAGESDWTQYEEFDTAVSSAVRGWQSAQVDLISGLCGVGVYLLERLPAPGAVAALSDLVDRLDAMAVRTGEGTWWATPPEWIPEDSTSEYPEGWCDLGVAHGVAGIVGLLAQIVEALPDCQEAKRLLGEAVEFLLARSRQHGGGADLPKGFRIEQGNLRQSREMVSHAAWCHGSLGLACALSRAAGVTGNHEWLSAAVAMGRAHAERLSQPKRHPGDTSLCHGLAGNAHLFHRLFQRSGDPSLGDAALRCYERLLEVRSDPDRPDAVGGFQVQLPLEDGTLHWAPSFGFLVGASGIGLSLLAGSGSIEPAWDRVLLI